MSLTEGDLAAIRNVIQQDADAMRRGDWHAATQLFTVDAVRFPPHHAPIHGRAAMLSWLETFPRVLDFDITADEIVGSDGVAFVRGRYAVALAPGPESQPMMDRGN